MTPKEGGLYVRGTTPEPVHHLADGVEVCVYTRPGYDAPNEDSVAVLSSKDAFVVVVADGVGGSRRGGDASEQAVLAMSEAVDHEERPLRDRIMSGFEEANRRALEIGSTTTLAVVAYEGQSVRTYHCGDSAVLVLGQRGKVKLQTVAHSPVGYALESGMLTEDEAFNHDERHLISNLVGSHDMRIEMGMPRKLARRDTVVVGSDGLFDNLTTDEIVDVVRCGDLTKAADELAKFCVRRMKGEVPGPSKVDDLSICLLRRTSG